MKLKYLKLFFISFLMISCFKRNKHSELKNNEVLIVDRIEHGCTHHHHYRDSIKYINQKYYVHEYQLIDTTMICVGFKSIKKEIKVFDENKFEKYFDSIIDYYNHNSLKGSTTAHGLIVYKDRDTMILNGRYYNQ